MQRYSQIRAMLAITKGSLRGLSRSSSAIIFGFAFPFVFILVFGFIGNNGGAPVYRIALSKYSDTTNALYDSIKTSNRVKIVQYGDTQQLNSALQKGRLTGVLNIIKNTGHNPAYTYTLKTTSASDDKWPQFLPVISSIVNKISNQTYKDRPTYAVEDFNYKRDVKIIREYKTIDFILPGQLGFSLLSAGVFGVAFMFFNLRNTLVLKRFFATPISRTYIVMGEGLARILFQMLTAVVIIVVGKYLFGFTLVHGFATLIDMLVLSFIGLLVFMGMGFIISGLAKNDSSIPPFANILTIPQFLLGGTFFSVEAFPSWLQPISKILPLTHLNTAMRQVAFEGLNLWDVRTEIGILLIWAVVVYAIAVKVFKWE